MARTPWSRARRLAAALIITALFGIVTAGLWLPAIGHSIAIPGAQLHSADAIAVLAGNPARTDYGVALYRRGLAPELWHTGYPDRLGLTVDVVVKDDGVPTQAFRYLATSSTWEDGQRIAATIRAQNLHKVILVTDWWHSRRALCSTEQQLGSHDVQILFEPSPSPFGPDNWWKDGEIRIDVLREVGKLGYYALRYGMRPWGC